MNDLDKARLAQLRSYAEWERDHGGDKIHVLDWAADEITKLRAQLEAGEAAKMFPRWYGCFFDGPPPSGHTDWHSWARCPILTGVRVCAQGYTHPAPVVPQWSFGVPTEAGHYWLRLEPTELVTGRMSKHDLTTYAEMCVCHRDFHNMPDRDKERIISGLYTVEGYIRLPAAQEKESLLKPAGHIQTGCYCKQGRCMAPVVMGRQTKCLDPNKAVQENTHE